ncbi:hypothetical protein BS50DRAFT_594071 [Corynespora cassiicola Philippines]|uniref:Polycomb protein VEFS-Box domain-containing protein n=1 Tax=Corynespora cassiicola Philippines TaxID=1448308 RepID=A0A2T2N4J8_CORCC|nr:hypothetical protein BS50DRAFT_594071 [Corynespora cassiicola Philippines]
MVGQFDKDITREYHGNLLYYKFLRSKRNPVFLDRNLRRALQIHQQQLDRENGARQQSRFPPEGWEHRGRQLWKLPSSAALHEMMERSEEKYFVLEIKGIKPTSPGTQTWGPPSSKRAPLFRFEVNILVTILDTNSGRQCGSSVHPQKATITGFSGDQGRVVSVDTPKFTVKVDELKEPEVQEEGAWGGCISEEYRLIASLNFLGSNDAEVFFSCLVPEDSSLQQNPSTRLSTTWDNIIECPPADIVLPFRASGSDKDLDMGFHVLMSWGRALQHGETILEALRRENSSTSATRSYLTPPLDSGPIQKKFKITYSYNGQAVTRNNLECPKCDKKNTFSVLDDLRMHLVTWHGHFACVATKESKDQDESHEHWLFECTTAEHRADHRASDHVPDPLNIQMIAPDQPFDQRLFLDEGNDGFWQSSRTGKQMKSAAKRRPPGTGAIRPVYKAPDQVQERKPARRIGFHIPKAPDNITFFRTSTKRPLKEGEEVSESEIEEDGDWDWLQVRKQVRIENDPAIPEAAKRFLKGFDPFIRDESLHSDLHLGDALVRFSRQKADWLWQTKTTAEFYRKLDELLSDEIITQEVRDWCWEFVSGKKPHDESDEQDDVPMEDAQTVGVLPNRCLCGEDALDSRNSRPMVSCSNISCIRGAFHIDCVENYWGSSSISQAAIKSRIWECATCQADSGPGAPSS